MRLIDADALLERIMDINSWYLYNEWGSETEFHKLIDEAPTVEPTDTDLISRADAIDALEAELRCTDREEDVSGLTLAKLLISALPSAELPKGDLISRKVLMDRLESFCKWCKDGRLQGAEFVWDCIVPNVPSAEAEEYDDYEHATLVDIKEPLKVAVVRCKDCRWWQDDHMGTWCGRLSGVRSTNADDYCSWGERREP